MYKEKNDTKNNVILDNTAPFSLLNNDNSQNSQIPFKEESSTAMFLLLNEHATHHHQQQKQRKWTLNLLICCLSAGLCSFSFGYNISSLNSVTLVVRKFIVSKTSNKTSNKTSIDGGGDIYFNNLKISDNMLWTLINSLFVLGILLGSLYF
jgi:hypothetical protein